MTTRKAKHKPIEACEYDGDCKPASLIDTLDLGAYADKLVNAPLKLTQEELKDINRRFVEACRAWGYDPDEPCEIEQWISDTDLERIQEAFTRAGVSYVMDETREHSDMRVLTLKARRLRFDAKGKYRA